MFGGIWDTGRAGAGEMLPPIPRSASRRGFLHLSERMVVDLLALADIAIVAIAGINSLGSSNTRPRAAGSIAMPTAMRAGA